MKGLFMIPTLMLFTALTAGAESAAVSVTNVWSRPATGTAVVYATFRNASSKPDRLVGATSPLATKVELHQSSTSAMPGDSMTMGNMSMPMGGSVVSMKSVASIPIPAHGSTSLAPGGYHLMLDLRRDLHAGERVPLRLHFAHAGWIAVVAHVRPI